MEKHTPTHSQCRLACLGRHCSTGVGGQSIVALVVVGPVSVRPGPVRWAVTKTLAPSRRRIEERIVMRAELLRAENLSKEVFSDDEVEVKYTASPQRTGPRL